MNTPVCDLILLSWNQLEQTQLCLETLFTHTSVPCRLFIVDNGSRPDVRAFLAGVAPRGAIREVTLLQNETNEGFPKGMNRGLAASTAPFVCLLNNDLRFAPGWLEEMLEVARAHPEIGVINPESNTFGHYPPVGVSLDTGRTHQIRVHMAHLGYPVLGDPTYGRHPAAWWQALGIQRQLLHAYRLTLRHPVRGQELTLSAQVPEDMVRWIDASDLQRLSV